MMKQNPFIFMILSIFCTIDLKAQIWNFSEWEPATFTEYTEINGLKINASEGNAISILVYVGTKYLKLLGKGSPTEQNIGFTAKESGELRIIPYLASDDTRYLDVALDGTVLGTLEVTEERPLKEGCVKIPESGEVTIYSQNSGILIYRMAFITNRVAPVVFSLEGNQLYMSTDTIGAAIYYTLDGSEPTRLNSLYTGPVELKHNCIIKAIAIKEGLLDSRVSSFEANTIDCLNVETSFDGHYLQLSSATNGARIYYTTDGSIPTESSQLYGGRIVIDKLCTVSAIAIKENMNNSGVTVMDIPYVYDGEKAFVSDSGMLRNAFQWNQYKTVSNRLEVWGNLNQADISFVRQLTSVEHLILENATLSDGILPDKAFAGMNLISIELPEGLKQVGSSLFEECNRLAAIIWHANINLTSNALLGVDNPNMIYYVNSTNYAPQGDNVVNLMTNSAANIILKDVKDGEGGFYCPRSFTAQNIAYTRNFQLLSGIGTSAGWETIALPFTVAEVRHETNGLLAPFGSNVKGAKPFWLYSLQSTGFNPAMEIVANTPYIICMPNNTNYAGEYNQGGDVTFISSNVSVPATVVVASRQETSNSYISLVPAFSRQAVSSSIYSINLEVYKNSYAPGSIFLPGLRDVRPFEAYSTVEMKSQVAVPPLYIPIFENQMPTGIAEVLKTQKSINDDWYTLDGRKLQQRPAKKGVYILNGRKMVVK